MELFKLFATIAIRNNEANDAIDDTTNKAEKSKSKISSAFAKIGKSVVEGLRSEHPKKFSQSLDELTNTVNKQNDKLQTLKNKYKDLYLTYGENSKEAKECAKEIKSLSAELKENEIKLSKADKAVDKFDQSLEDASESAEKTENRMSSAFKKIGAAVISYFAVDKIKDFGLECINAASDLEATSAQFSQVFGNLESTASTNLTKIADSTGVVENRMKGSYTKIAAFAKTTGMDTADALGLADRAMVAIADSAAFYDRTLEETTESLQSFLKGNYENDAALGLSCTETTRNAAANQLYGKSFKDLSEQQKQLTLLQMVEDANKLSGAMGQSARETDTWTNQTGNLKQAWQDLKANLGTTVLSTVVDVVKSLSEKVQNASEKFDEWKPKIQNVIDKSKEMADWVRENKTLLLALGGVIASVTAGMIAFTIAEKAKTIATQLHTAATFAEKLGVLGVNTAMLASPITWIVAAIVALIAIIVLLVKNWDKVKEVASNVWDKIKEIWSNVSEWFKTNVIDPIVNFFQGLWDKVVEIWEGIKNAISFAFQLIANIISAAFQIITLPFRFIWENCKEYVFAVFDAIREFINNAINKIKEIITTVLNAIKTVWNTVWTAVKDFLMPIINSIKDFISTAFNAIKNIISTVINTVKTVISTVFNAIRDVITNIINSVKNTVTNVFNAIKNAISVPLNAAKSTVSNVFDAIRDKIDSVISKAKDIVQKGLDTIKGFFDKLKLKFPDLKLPHFKVDGEFSVNPPKVPKFAIDWYDKAMDDGMIMNEPTIFGVNSKGQFMAGGETGSETVVGTQSLMNMINNAVGQSNNSLYDVLDKILAVLKNIDNSMYDRIVAALQTMGIEFDERELARLVKKYA